MREEFRGRVEISVFAEQHQLESALKEFEKKIKDITVENYEDEFSPYFVSIDDFWIERGNV